MSSALFRQAIDHHLRGRLAEAARLYGELLASDPKHCEAMHMLGLVRHQTGRHREAIELIRAALARDANQPLAHTNIALAYQALGEFDEALASCDRSIALAPNEAAAHNNRGNALVGLARFDDAVASYERALSIDPRHPESLKNLAIALHERGKAELASRQYERAIDSFDRALAIDHRIFAALLNRGVALRHLSRQSEALASYERAIALRPDSAQAHFNRGNALRALERPDEASHAFARALELDPEYPFAKGHLLHTRTLCCDWTDFGLLTASIRRDLLADKAVADPFGHLGVTDSEHELQICASMYAAAQYPRAAPPYWTRERYDHAKIRVGYVSGEFRHQATSILMVELFERHDRDRFEIVAFDNGWNDGSALRRRLERAFDTMVDISKMDDTHAASEIHRRHIDILVNLNGYFGLGRQGVFSRCPAPVQVSYLGFPGTLGTDYIDYLIADRHVIAPEREIFYNEKVVRLPDTYQCNDSQRPIAERTPSRAEAGLPPNGFVFCCFNNPYKITPQVFDVWMRLLGRVEGSVLWLIDDNPAAKRNLRSEAQRRGIDPERLRFAPRIDLDAHLARHRVADLFLDTLPYNAHTTASDALWAGLPLLTCMGAAFAGRVASSLLRAIGLPELVTSSLADYEALAVQLATSPEPLSTLRARLATNRRTYPLFDTDRFREHLEAAYERICKRVRAGLPPEAFTIA